MFKKNNLFAASILGVSMALTGCGASSQATGTKDVDAKELLKTASTKFAEVKSYEMGMNVAMSMDMKEQGKLDMTMDTNGKMIVNPEMACQLDSSISMKLGDQNQDMTTQQYIVKEDADYTMYAEMLGTWSKTKVGGAEQVEALMQDPSANIDVYLEKIDDITISGEESIEGIDCYALKINLTKEYFDTVLGDMDGLSNLGLDEATISQTIETLEGIDNLPVYYYVSKESSEIVGMNMDMGDLIKSVLIGSGKVTEDQIGDVKMTMNMTITNVDGVEEVKLPEEAKSAVEM